MRRFALLVLLAGCRQLLGFEEATVAPDDDAPLADTPADVGVDAWTRRRTLVVDGTQVTGNLTNFPVLVRFASDPDLAMAARADGFDLRFTAADGVTPLPYERESFDPATGALAAWVLLPSVPRNIDTPFLLYFGNPLAADQQSPAAVWDANYLGVWHLAEAAGGTVADSTALARTGTKVAADRPAPAPGLIGGGQRFTGGEGGISIGNANDLDRSSITIEMWLQLDPCTGDVLRRLIDFPANFNFSWAFGYPCAGTASVNANALVLGAEPAHVQTRANTLRPDLPHHLVFVSSPPRLVLDGQAVELANTNIALAQDNTNAILGNRESTADRAMIGLLDEVRISKTERPEAYASTSYANQRPDSTFLIVGPVEELPLP